MRPEPPPPGKGSIVIEVVAAASAVISAAASAPLKLLVPRPRGMSAWAYAATFGGGFLAGDVVDLDIRVGPGARALCATQASTKVYKSERDAWGRQTVSAAVGEGGLLALLPDPVCAFAGARYAQRQTIELARGASLVLVDTLVSGRAARGERYRFSSYRTHTEIFVEGSLVAVDAMKLEDTPESRVSERMGRFDALVTAFILGPLVETNAAALVESFAKEPAGVPDRPQPILKTASPLPGGVMLRVAAEDPEAAAALLRRSLAFLPELLGDNPWARKW